MQQSADSPNSHDQSVNRRVTVAEAAQLLGVSTDSIRSRLRRGTLKREDAADGTILVVLSSGSSATDSIDSQPTVSTSRSTNHPTVEYVELLQAHIARLEQEIADRKEEGKRKDHLLAAALERIPAIEAPQEAREASVSVDHGAGNGDVSQDSQGQEKRSWWRRFFGY